MITFNKIFKISIMEELQYKVSYISGIICQLAFGFMYIMLYSTFYNYGVPQDFTTEQMSTYVWLSQMFFAAICFTDVCKKEISVPISNGNVGYQMVKPINLYTYWFMQVLAKPTAAALIRALPIFVITFFLPKGYGLTLPSSWTACLLFFVSIILGLILIASIRMICYYVVLYTFDSRGVFSIVGAIFSLLAGCIIPIPLMPSGVQKILNFMPFRYVNDLPYRIYMGNIGASSALIQIGIQLVWIALIVAIGVLLINNKSKKLVVQGG